ncbi:MAG: hypothetical protein NC393_13905, partial [Clostridium sp.]|nr:hypothetical protein [Clostridium sp.]MCM1173207.1 hypothetical protein [Clostridium sp.]MCM1208322.1 hypothetical protein [Ruminococcus sp.]
RKNGEQIIEDKESAEIARDYWTDINDWRNTIVAGSSEEVQEAINLVNQRESAVRLLGLSLQAVKILWKHTL